MAPLTFGFIVSVGSPLSHHSHSAISSVFPFLLLSRFSLWLWCSTFSQNVLGMWYYFKIFTLPGYIMLPVSADPCLSLVLTFSWLLVLQSGSLSHSFYSLLYNSGCILELLIYSSLSFSVFYFFSCVYASFCFLQIYLQFTNPLCIHVYFAVSPIH